MERQALQVGLSMQYNREKSGKKVDRNEELRHYLRRNMDQSNESRDVGSSFLNASGIESTSKPL